MSKTAQLTDRNRPQEYGTPALIRLGAMSEVTGHCSKGCDHDSYVHQEYKKTC